MIHLKGEGVCVAFHSLGVWAFKNQVIPVNFSGDSTCSTRHISGEISRKQHIPIEIEEQTELNTKFYTISIQLPLDPSHSSSDVEPQQTLAGHNGIATRIVGLHLAGAIATISVDSVSIITSLIGSKERISTQTHAISISIDIMCRGASTVEVAELIVECGITGLAVDDT